MMKRMSALDKQNLIHQRNLTLGLEMVREALLSLGQFDALAELVDDGFIPHSPEVDQFLLAHLVPDEQFCACPPHPIDPEYNGNVRYVSSYVEQKRFKCPQTGKERSLWYCISCGHRNITSAVPDNLTRIAQEARAKFPGEGQGSDLNVLPKKV